VPRQTHAAHHVHVEEALPVLIRDVFKCLGLEDADIVHQDIGVGHARDKRRDARCGREVRGDALGLRSGDILCQTRQRRLHAFLAASVDEHVRAGPRKPRRNGKTDARRRAGNHGALAGKVNIHWHTAPVACATRS
jgi:hypothetical protein